MGKLRKKSTSTHPLHFMMVQSADHVSPLTGATVTVTISKDGGAFATPAGAVTEIANGWYQVAGNATDTNTLGPLIVHATATGGDPCDSEFQVVAFNPDDAAALGLTGLSSNVPGTAGGLLINGTNNGAITFGTGMTISSATGTALQVSSFGGNGNAIGLSPNGSGVAVAFGASGTNSISVAANISMVGGVTINNTLGDAMTLQSSAANGNALNLISSGTGAGVVGTFSAALLTSISSAIWDTLTSAARTAGSYGAKLKALVIGSDSKVMVSSDTGAVPIIGTPAGASVSADIAAAQTAINNLNNLSALANLFGPGQLEVPASGSIAYPYTLTIKDSEGHLVDLNATPTVTAANGAGVDRSANLSAVSHPGTGQYTFTYTVSSAAAQEGIAIKATGTTVAPDSTPRLANSNVSIVSVDTTATLAAIQAQTAKIGTNAGDSGNAITAQATIATNLNATVASRSTLAAGAKMDLVDAPNAAAVAALQAGLSRPGTAQTINDGPTDAKLATMLQGVAPSAFTPAALANAPTGGGGGGGLSGPSSVTLTFRDAGGAPVANVPFAILAAGVTQGIGRTDAGGVATFGITNGTYSVVSGMVGFVLFPNAALVVAGATALTITGANVAPAPPTAAGTINGVLYLRRSGAVAAGVVVTFQQTGTPPGESGFDYDQTPFTVTSDVTGQVVYPFTMGAQYRYQNAKGDWSDNFTPPTSGTSFLLPDGLGFFT